MTGQGIETWRSIAERLRLGKVELEEIERLLGQLAERKLPDPYLGSAFGHKQGGAPCCASYEMFGYAYCTCWVEVHTPGQSARRIDEPIEDRDGMCGDCAFRPASPELKDDPKAVADRAKLMDCVLGRGEFFCHDGMRRIVAMRHPKSGMVVEVEPQDGVTPYDPPIEDGIAYRLDGRPALRCGGLVAARKSRTWNPWRKDER